jgi:eukaryotic-like serine/threonine-protein kinase
VPKYAGTASVTDSPEFSAVVRPGDVLAGKYRVERVLGAGGMGVVVAAHHVQLDTKVALKFLLPEALKNAEAVGRFIREARAAVKITGDHVARVSDVGQLENGSPYIVMEYLEGIDLSGWLKKHGPLPIELAVDFVLQACEAIADAHALGIVHRDLKPANLFCVQRSDGQLSIKVLDFGISKVITPGASGHDMTRTNALFGSPFYMSPEQMQSSKRVDPRTDIWSLGIILFELLSGRTPFDGESVTELAIKVATEPAPPLRGSRMDAPAGLELAIMSCLQKDLARRYQTVGELAMALADFGSRQARASVDRILGTLRQAGLSRVVLPPPSELLAPSPQSPMALAPTAIAPTTGSAWGDVSRGQTARPVKSGAMAAVAVAALVVVAASAAGGLVLLRRQATAPLPPTPTTATGALVAPSAASLPVVVAAGSADTVPTTTPSSTPAAPALSAAGGPATRSSATAPHPTALARAPASGPAGPDCDPNFILDDQGRKHWKPECFLKK